MKRVALLLISAVLSGCGSKSYEWRVDRRPETIEERNAVALETIAILKAVPIQKLEGHDQDWDDAISTAYKSAAQNQCQSRLYEWEYTGFLEGNWKETGRIKTIKANE